jgi:hypothetical protein
VHLRQRGGALAGRRRARRATVARAVGGRVESAGVAAQVARVGLGRGRRPGGRHRQRVDVDVAAIAGGAHDADRVGSRRQRDVGGNRGPFVPACRRGQSQGPGVRAVDDQVDGARRRAAERAEVVGVAQRHPGLAGRGAQDGPGGRGRVGLAQAGDEPGHALVVRVVGLDVGRAGQRGGAGVADLVEGALVLPGRADRGRLACVPVAHRDVGRPERPRSELVPQSRLGGGDREPPVTHVSPVGRHREAPVHRVDRRQILEVPGRRVLHPDQAVAEHLEPGVARRDRRAAGRDRGREVDGCRQVDRRIR